MICTTFDRSMVIERDDHRRLATSVVYVQILNTTVLKLLTVRTDISHVQEMCKPKVEEGGALWLEH